MKKIQLKTCHFLMLFSVVFMAACTNTSNKPLLRSSLQIIGFNDNIAVEDNDEPITLYLTYGFNNKATLQINRLSKDDFDKGVSSKPIEERVGQFGVFSSGFMLNNIDSLKRGTIKYNITSTFGNQNFYIQDYGNSSELYNANGQILMDLHRDLKLFELIQSMHELGEAKYTEDFYSLDMFKRNPSLALSAPIPRFRLDIILEYETKLGKVGRNTIKLLLQPAILPSVSVR
jgi:hypothetical protein